MNSPNFYRFTLLPLVCSGQWACDSRRCRPRYPRLVDHEDMTAAAAVDEFALAGGRNCWAGYRWNFDFIIFSSCVDMQQILQPL